MLPRPVRVAAAGRMPGDVEEILGGERQAGQRTAGCAGDAHRRAGDEGAGHRLEELRRRRAVLEGRDELALDGIDPQPEPFQGVSAQHVEVARITEEADGMERSSLEGDEHLRGVALGELDRKSTRLNSSHSQISYAVFCLKKK